MLELLRIVSGWSCILAGAAFAGFAALIMWVAIDSSNSAGPLLAFIFAVPAVFFFALASYAFRKDPSERDDPF